MNYRNTLDLQGRSLKQETEMKSGVGKSWSKRNMAERDREAWGWSWRHKRRKNMCPVCFLIMSSMKIKHFNQAGSFVLRKRELSELVLTRISV